MKKEIYTCDGCGKEKGETNHWFAASVDTRPGGFAVITTLETSHTHEPAHSNATWEHFCGEECLLKMVARNLPK
jgi:hypothetical protein